MKGKGKLLFLSAVILFSLTLSPIYASSNALSVNSDSVNIKQLIYSQIQEAKAKAEVKVKDIERNSASAARETLRNRDIKPDQSTETESGVNFSQDLFLKIFILVDAALSVFLFVLWRRRKLKGRMAEKKNLKNNIIRLREEKVGRKSDSRLDTKRKKLRLEPAFNMASDNDEFFVSHAKKLSVSVGELQLAARLSSFERERG